LHIKVSADKLSKYLRNVAAANPAGVYEHRELVGVEPEGTPRLLSVRLLDFVKLGIDGAK
jgi:Ni,Fe-hydrogenase III component G